MIDTPTKDPTMLKTLATLAATAILAGGFAAVQTETAHAAKRTTEVNNTFRPCWEEDSIACTWDAEAFGNGTGTSFRVNSDGQVFNISHCEAHRRIHSWLLDRGYIVGGYDEENDRFVWVNYNRSVDNHRFVPVRGDDPIATGAEVCA